MSNSYDELIQDVYDSKDIGSGVINGVECDFVAFRKDDVDLQLWIAQGDKPYPCLYVLTSSLVAGGPQYSIAIRNWKTGSEVAADDFAFQPPANAEKIELKDLQDKIAELPGHFKMGANK